MATTGTETLAATPSAPTAQVAGTSVSGVVNNNCVENSTSKVHLVYIYSKGLTDIVAVRSYHNVTVQLICSCGDLEALQWLVETFRLGRDDILDNNGAAFGVAAKHGHKHILLWLLEHFM